MAICIACGKKRAVGNNISHANNKTKKLILPNLQRVRIAKEGSVKKGYVCTRCLRSGVVKKAV